MRRITKPNESRESDAAPEAVEGEPVAAVVPGKRKRRERLGLVKLTLEIPRELDFRLSGIASSRGMRKHALIAKLLDQGCGSFKMDESLKVVWRESQGQNMSAA